MPIDKDNPLVEPIWERQRHETEKAFTAFKIYRDLPYGAYNPYTEEELEPDSRSLAKLGHILGRTKTHLENWSSAWAWVERVEAYDKEIETIENIERVKARRVAARKMEERALVYREDAASLYQQVKDKVNRMLAFPIHEEERVEVVDTNGEPTGEIQTIIKPANWNLNTLAKLITSLEDLARFAAGADQMGVMDKLLEKIDPATLTPDQRRRIINGEPIIEVIFSASPNQIPSPDH